MIPDQCVDDAVSPEKGVDHNGNHRPGKEIGHDQHGLDCLRDRLQVQFVQDDCQKHGQGCIDHNKYDIVADRIPGDPERILRRKEEFKIPESDKFTVKEPFDHAVILKCQNDTEHRPVIKQDQINQYRKRQHMQLPVFFEMKPDPLRQGLLSHSAFGPS